MWCEMLDLGSLRRKLSLKDVVALEIVGLMTVLAFFLHGGEDLFTFYLPLARGCLTCAYNPWHTMWVVFPLRFIPVNLLWPFWILASGLMLWWTARQLKVNPTIVLLSFPAMGLIWLGQVDAVVALGLGLALTARSPWLRGLGIALASIKPQVSAVAILVLLWLDHDRWRVMIVPAAVLAASMVAWGPDWPLRWWRTRDITASLPLWGMASLFPVGLAAFAAIPFVDGPRNKVTAALLASALAIPQFGVYSYVAFLVFLAPGWALPLSYAWALAYPFIQGLSLELAWVLPLGLLGCLLWPSARRWVQRRKEPAGPPEPDPAQE